MGEEVEVSGCCDRCRQTWGMSPETCRVCKQDQKQAQREQRDKDLALKSVESFLIIEQ